MDSLPPRAVLEITDAWEGMEVWVNGVSAGIQIVPVYRFEIARLLHRGTNWLAIEVATTLERERAAGKQGIIERLQLRKTKDPTGITGLVRLYAQAQEVGV